MLSSANGGLELIRHLSLVLQCPREESDDCDTLFFVILNVLQQHILRTLW